MIEDTTEPSPSKRLIIGVSPDGFPIRQMKDGHQYEMRPDGLRDLQNLGDSVLRGTEQAVGKRLTARALAANGEDAEQWFLANGYETKRWASGWGWGYRKKGKYNRDWQPVNPEGLDLGDVVSALVDFGGGIISGVGATAAAALASPSGPGAIAAGMAGGAAGMALAETSRQAAGAAVGIPNNFDPTQIGLAGVAGGLAIPVGAAVGGSLRTIGRMAKTAVRGTSRITPEFASKLIGVEGFGEGMARHAGEASMLGEAATGGRVMMEGIALTQRGTIPLKTPEKAGELARQALSTVLKERIPEVRAKQELLGMATKRGATADLTLAIEEIAQYTPIPGSTSELHIARMVSPTIAEESSKLIVALQEGTGFFGDWSKVPVQAADEIIHALQKISYGEGLSRTQAPSDLFTSMTRVASGKARSGLKQTMVQFDPTWNEISQSAEEITKGLKVWRKALALDDNSPEGYQTATNTIRGLFGDSKTSYLAVLNQFDRQFLGRPEGTFARQVLSVSREAMIGERLGQVGLGGEVPKLTAGGGFRGMQIIGIGGGAGAGAIVGGPGGALVGATAGALLGSPRIMLRYTAPGASAVMNAADRVATRLAQTHLGSSSRILADAGISSAQLGILRQMIAGEGSGSKGLARQDGPKPKKTILIGG